MELTPEQGRVLGALVEKELTTPQGYPLTDNALLAACNQTTSRDPVVSYDLATLRTAVRDLREQGLLRTVHRPGERSEKHRHELPAVLGLSPEQVAVLAVLLLRGPQTAAELRARTERMQAFGSTEEVEQVLAGLAERGEPLVGRLERQPGRKEPRWVQLLARDSSVPLPVLEVEPVVVASEMLAALEAALTAGDVEAAVALFEPDAVLLRGQELAIGQDELRGSLTALTADGGTRWEDSDLTVGERAGVVWVLLIAVGGSASASLVLVPAGGTHRIAHLHMTVPTL